MGLWGAATPSDIRWCRWVDPISATRARPSRPQLAALEWETNIRTILRPVVDRARGRKGWGMADTPTIRFRRCLLPASNDRLGLEDVGVLKGGVTEVVLPAQVGGINLKRLQHWCRRPPPALDLGVPQKGERNGGSQGSFSGYREAPTRTRTCAQGHVPGVAGIPAMAPIIAETAPPPPPPALEPDPDPPAAATASATPVHATETINSCNKASHCEWAFRAKKLDAKE